MNAELQCQSELRPAAPGGSETSRAEGRSTRTGSHPRRAVATLATDWAVNP